MFKGCTTLELVQLGEKPPKDLERTEMLALIKELASRLQETLRGTPRYK